MKILKIILILICFAAAEDDMPVIDMPDNTDPPRPNETNHLATLGGIYVKVRDAVKYAYDEIIYFERMNEKRKQIGDLMKKTSMRVERIFDESAKLFTDPKSVWTTLENMEDIFDDIDNIYLEDFHELDNLIADQEDLYDAAVNRNNAYTGYIIPKTHEILNYVEALFQGKPYEFTGEEIEKMTEEEFNTYKEYYLREQRLAAIIDTTWQDERVRKGSLLLATISLSKVGTQKKWIVNQLNQMRDLDEMFADIDGVNPIELGATWWAIETNNSHNKLIEASLEEAKALQAYLGLNAYDVSKRRGRQLTMKKDFSEFATELYAHRQRIEEENR